MSCSSSKLSSSLEEGVDKEAENIADVGDTAIICFPDGTIGRVKASKLKQVTVSHKIQI